jgi:hypothetical protein
LKKILLVALVGLAIVASGVALSNTDKAKDTASGPDIVLYGTKPGG